MATSAEERKAWTAWGLVGLGVVALLGPSYWKLYQLVWKTDDQGHGPIIVAVSFFLLWRLKGALAAMQDTPRPVAGGSLLAFALLAYVLGRSQEVIQLEVFAHLVLLVGLVLLLLGPRSLRVVWFPIFFLFFMVPLPGVLVQTITVPLKLAVSHVVEALLYHAGYPIARAGVVLNIGPFQLLVADACAGLNSMFTLEALGLLYMNLMGYTSRLRNVLLALLIIPISFCANVVRVMVLVLVTYYFGDAAGQGFIHDFAGMVLFLVGLMLMLFTDGLLGRVLRPVGKA